MTAAQDISYSDAVSSTCSCATCNGIAASGGGFSAPSLAVAAGHTGVRGAELLPQTDNGDGTYSFGGDRNIDAVLIGSRWTSSTLTYTFPTDGDYAPPEYAGQFQMNADQQAAARDGFRLIAGYTGLVIVEVAPDRAEEATFRLSNTTSFSVGSAQGAFPGFVGGEGGDIWFGRTDQPYYETPERGNWGYSTMLHEIGHTMGLKHGQDDYSNEDIGPLFGDEPLFGTRAIEYDKDGQAWSLMTYTGGPDGLPTFQGEGENQAQTFMQLDIAALQFLYGANFATNAKDSVYRWDPATGQGFINGVGQGRPTGNVVFETIWDGGGTDTYDLSNYGGGITVDLRPGAFSTFSVEQRADNNALVGGPVAAPGNIGNALLYQGDVRSLIENAIGGAGNDRLVGNQVANRLSGGAGDDVLAGGLGSDTLIGGAGDDVADFTGAASGITVKIDRAADLRIVNGVDTDILVGIEGAIGTAFDDRLTGDAGANLLSGGAGGRDELSGGAGDDRLVGAGYVLAWRDEADIVRGPDPVNRSIRTAISLDGSFEYVARDGVATNAAYPGAVLPHATVVAAAGGSEGVDYYSFTATAGARALFDIDATNNFTGLEILNSKGRILASNYREGTTDDGSRRGTDARLEYVFQTGGTFYVRVTGSGFDAERRALQADQGYTLAVSLEDAAVAAPVIRSTGAATLDGGTGDDHIVATAGSDRIDGGVGSDTLSYENHFRAVTVDLSLTAAQETGAGRDTIQGIENLTGTRYADTLAGNAAANVIDGGGGSDTIDGGAGIDTLSFASQVQGVTVSLGKQNGVQTYRLGQRLTASGFENLTGSGGDDILTGDIRSNRIDGGDGDDTLVVVARGDPDTLLGGAGSDTASFKGADVDITATLRDDETGVAKSAGNLVATLRGIENLTGGAGDDLLKGNAAANDLAGGIGDDKLLGGAGDDRIEGGLGDDRIDGGAGTDTAVFTGAIGAVVDLRVTLSRQTGYGGDRLLGIENIETGSGDDRIHGNADDNLFVDGGGDDEYDGDAGFDTLSFAGTTGQLKLDLSDDGLQDSGARGTKRIVDIEGLIGGSAADYLTGNRSANAIAGSGGDDILVGGRGRDVLTGDEGDDVLVGDTLGLIKGIDPRTSGDRLSGGAGSDLLIGGAGVDTLDGGEGDDVLSNGSFASSVFDGPFGLFFDRGSLIRVDGGNGDIDGGAGNDFAILAYNGRKDGVIVDVRDSAARTTILSGGVAAGSIVNVERLGFEGGDGDDIVYGGAGYDLIATAAGNDFVDAGLGDDVVFAGAGNDIYDGGGGSDLLSFEDATAGITFDLLRSDAQETGGGGIITASGFERVQTSRFDDTIYLTDRADNFEESQTGNDSFYGRGGDDVLSVQRFEAAASKILLDGGDGNDELSLLSFDDNLHDITFDGGAGNDIMIAIGAKTTIADGGSGNDYFGLQIFGGAGSHAFTVTMGEGADRLFFDADSFTPAVERTDTIVTDFSVAEDVLLMNRVLEGIFDADGELAPLLSNYALGDDPFKTGHYRLMQSGTSTLVQIDQDGMGDAARPVTILTLRNVEATSLTAANFNVRPNTFNGDVVGDPSWTFVTPTAGTNAAELLTGTGGRDRLSAMGGNDTLRGLGADDVLSGGDGKDRLDGGTGRDLLYGGTGNDVFLFKTAAQADGDAIRDFSTGDIIDLSATDAVSKAPFAWIGSEAFGGIAGELRVTIDANGFSVVAGDIDGDEIADFAISILTDHILTTADFIL